MVRWLISVVDLYHLELLVELQVEAVVQLHVVAAAVTVDLLDRSAGETLLDGCLDLLGDEGLGHAAALALDLAPVAFLVELYLLAALVHHVEVAPVGGDDQGHLVAEVLFQHGLCRGGQLVEGDHSVVVGHNGHAHRHDEGQQDKHHFLHSGNSLSCY